VAASPHAFAALQRSAGNAATSLAIQRLAGAPASPKQDPKFLAVTAQVKQQGAKLRKHPPPAAEAKKAQDAAVAPPDDREAKAKASRADEMATAKPGGFDKAAFIAAVKAAVAAQAPKNLDEADSFASSGKAENVKAAVAGKVTEGKAASAKDIAEKTAKPPDPAAVPAKPVAPLAPEQPAAVPLIDAGKAMPARAPPAATDLSAPKAETDKKMADAGVTEQQLAKSNEPEFTGALAAKKEGEQHSKTAPGPVRAAEGATLAQATQSAKATGAAGMAAMVASKNSKTGQVGTGKNATKARDEQKRAEFAAHVKGIFDGAKTDVDAILKNLDTEVAQRFDAGERDARAAFTADHKARMKRYKDERYDGITGAARWTADLFTGLPEEANQIYALSKQLYESKMERVISDVADLIGARLTQAKNRIATAQAEIKKFVASQPKDLQKIAQEAADSFQAQFAALEGDIDSKRDALVDDLASRYVEARNAVDAEIKTMQEENRGLWDKAMDAIGGAIDTIVKLKDMLLGVLARAAGAIEKIIDDPIGFLGNFVNAVKAGIQGFAANIVTHLKKGLQTWLFGALAEAGIEIPETFDLKGIVKLILSILGLTWANIRARIVKALPGAEKVMALLEKGVEFIQVILGEGIGGLWKFVAAKLADLKEMVMGKIREFVVTRIITGGITWLISLLNPAAAFIKACKMIYDVVMFFVDNAAQIKEFVDSVLDSIESIAGGGVGAVASLIENALAKTLPIVLGFLASLLNLGGISDKIKSILKTVQKPVMSIIDSLVAGAVKFGKKLLLKLGIGRKDAPEAKSPSEVKGKARAALEGKKFATQADADAALEAVFVRLQPEGLKGLKLVPGGAGKKPYVLASASVPDRIALEQDPAAVFQLALKMQTRTGTTTAFVTYDGDRRFGPGAGYTNRGAHAEQRIAKDAPALLARIAKERTKLKTPVGTPVPILIDMNRLPCDHCGDTHITNAFGGNKDVAVTVRGASVWQSGFGTIPLTTAPGIRRLMEKGIKVEPMHVWPLIVSRMKELGATGELQVGKRVYNVREWLNLNAGTYGADAFDVDEVLEKVNRGLALKPTTKGAVGT
jgi:hypothetical protein